jgi:hypothetical protein
MTLSLGMRWNYTEMEEMETLNEAVHQSFSVPSARAKVYGDSSLHVRFYY